MKSGGAFALLCGEQLAKPRELRQAIGDCGQPEVNVVLAKAELRRGGLPERWERPCHSRYFIARAMLFHQGSCSSEVCHANSLALVLIVSVSPPTVPSRVALMPRIFARSRTFTASSAVVETITRVCVSPNNRASTRVFENGERSICAPINRGVSRAICWEMQHSARATASPPSLQSCALLMP